MPNLKCFIASAFDQDDVDKVYLKGIKPVLKDLGISPFRVDKINHNDKIDTKIVQLIQKCDFAIADLTFARPSVYYEAGYLEGLGKPVIFIVRTDHFKAKPEDIPGNLKVHFDLITKNIIPWSADKLEVFKRKLKSRILLVQKPLVSKVEKSTQLVQSEQQFATLPVRKRIELVESTLKAIIQDKGYIAINLRFYRNIYQKGHQRLLIKVTEKLTKEDLQYSRHDYEINEFKYKLSVIHCSLSTVSQKRLESSLPTFAPTQNGQFKGDRTTINIICPVTSLVELQTQLDRISTSY